MAPHVRHQIKKIRYRASSPTQIPQNDTLATPKLHNTIPITPLEVAQNARDEEVSATEQQTRDLCNVIKSLSSALNTCQEEARINPEALRSKCEVLTNTARVLHGNRCRAPEFVDTVADSLQKIVELAKRQRETIEVVTCVKKTVKDQLDDSGLGTAMTLDGLKLIIGEKSGELENFQGNPK